MGGGRRSLENGEARARPQAPQQKKMPDLRELFPSMASAAAPPRLAVGSHRILLVAPPDGGKTSMLLQLAFNRARRGLSSLVVSCGSAEGLALHPPVRPRLSTGAGTSATPAASAAASAAEDTNLLRLVHIKYVATWPELQEVLVSVHVPQAMPATADSLPRAILIDGLSSLFTSSSDAAAGGPASHVATPSPSKPEQQHTAMWLALAMAMAAHAADHLDAAAARDPSVDGTAPPRAAAPEPALLVVACSRSDSPPEPELASRWLPTLLQATPLPPARESGRYVVSCRRTTSTLEEAYCHYVHVPAKELRLLESGHGYGGGLMAGAVPQRAAMAALTPVQALALRPPPQPESHAGDHRVNGGNTGGRGSSPLASGPLASAIF